MRTIEIKAVEFDNASEAIQDANAAPWREPAAVSLAGRYFAMEKAEADRIAAMGIEFAYLFNHEMPDGTFRIMTVPVND